MWCSFLKLPLVDFCYSLPHCLRPTQLPLNIKWTKNGTLFRIHFSTCFTLWFFFHLTVPLLPLPQLQIQAKEYFLPPR